MTCSELGRVLLLSFLTFFLIFVPALGQAQSLDTTRKAYKNVPTDYIDEAFEFLETCETTYKLDVHYSCECLSVKFLDQRIAQGPSIPQNALLLNIQNECADGTGLAGKYYNACLSAPPAYIGRQTVEDFCECYGNRFGELYEQYAPGTGSKAMIALGSRAKLDCTPLD